MLGPDHLDLSDNLLDVGFAHQAMGDYAESRAYYERVLAIYKKAGTQNHGLGMALVKLAVAFNHMGDALSARSYYEQALAVFQKLYGIEHEDTASVLHQ